MSKRFTIGILIAGILCFASAAWAIAPTPLPIEQDSRSLGVDPLWDADVPINLGKSGAADTVWIRVRDDSSCSFTGNPLFGTRGARTPSWSVWCFDGGLGDSCSTTSAYGSGLPGCWTHYDAHVFGQTNKWHVDTYDAYLPGSEDSSMWCGEYGDTLTWDWPPGYGPGYTFSMVADLGAAGSFATANGMTIGGVHLFATELAYDYCFMEIGASGIPDTSSWREIGRFNGISNPDSTNCRGLPQSYWGVTGPGGVGQGIHPYLCADWTPFNIKVSAATMATLGQNGTEHIFVRWRVDADLLWDDKTGGGSQANTIGAWRFDHFFARGDLGGSSFPPGDPSRTDFVDFESLSEPGRSSFITKLLPAAELPGGYWAGTLWVHGKPAIADTWHLTNTPSYANQAKTCETTNRWLWAANLNLAGADQNIEYNNFYMRLASPVFDTSPTSPLTAGTSLAGQRITGNIITYDGYICIKQISQDATDRVVRFYDAAAGTWRGWENDNFVNVGGCTNWTASQFDDWSGKAFATMDSVQYGFEIFDQCDYNSPTVLGCIPGFVAVNPHRKNTFLFDNVSVGFFSQTSTQWTADLFGLFQDTYALDKYIHPATVENGELAPGDFRDVEDSLTITVTDINGIVANSVVMHYRVSTDCGTSWTHETSRVQGSKAKPTIEWFTKTLNLSETAASNPPPGQEFNGTYTTTIELNTTDLPGSILSGGLLRPGTVVEYYMTSQDNGGARDTIPDRRSERRNFIHPMWGAERQTPWPFEVTVFPCIQSWAGVDSVLLYNDWYNRTGYDAESDKNLAGIGVNVFPFVSQLYEEALRDLNVRYERFDNNTSNISRGQGAGPFYTEPTDKDGYGGIRNPATARNRYNAVIWPSGRANEYTVTDSSQLEIGSYLASDANEGNIWVSGVNLCEDEGLAGSPEAFNGGDFYINYVGASLVAGGCEDNSGIAPKRYYIEGVNNALYTPFTSYGGWSDCPLRDQPDADFNLNVAGLGTETIVLQFDNIARTLNETAGIRNVQPGTPNKMVTTMFGLDQVTTRAARACLTRAILTDFGVTIGAATKYDANDCDATGNPVDVTPGTGVVRKFGLDQNYPNPFNPSTRIRYSLPKDNMKVELKIFDVSGRQVKTLVNRLQSGAEHEIFWDGRNDRGEDVSSGVYFYSLTADTQSATKKMVLLK